MLSAPPARTTSARASLDVQAGVDHRLQPGATAAIDLCPGHRDRKAGVECRDPAEGGGIAVRVALAEDDVVDLL